jgi:hypothetical protein
MPKSIAMLFALAGCLAAGVPVRAFPQEKHNFELEIFGGASFAGERTCATPATAG